MYRYVAELRRVIDGDTMDFELDLGFHITKLVRIRVKDFDAPEIRGEERPEGLIAKAKAEKILSNNFLIVVETSKDRSFDRWVGNIYVDGKDFKELMNEN